MDTARFLDRDHWRSGPWDDEPDRAEWYDLGRPCLAIRNGLGAWCGYVAVDPGHPWHGLHYDDVPVTWVHHGLTFASPCMEDHRPHHERVCHIPRPGEPDNVWWLGFDCAHGSSDVLPFDVAAVTRDPPLSMEAFQLPGATYKSLDFVRAQCRVIAQQINAAAGEPKLESTR